MKKVREYLGENTRATEGKIKATHTPNAAFIRIYWSSASAWDEKARSFKCWSDGNEK